MATFKYKAGSTVLQSSFKTEQAYYSKNHPENNTKPLHTQLCYLIPPSCLYMDYLNKSRYHQLYFTSFQKRPIFFQ